MTLYEYDRTLAPQAFCGIDEAGRGPLAGDVYAAAVVLPLGEEIEGINDSKKLTEKKRERLYDEITSKALAWSVGVATIEEIERLNILNATFLAMRRAVEGLPFKPAFALIDGNKNPDVAIPSRCLVKGDGISASIAAASIVAKVARDRYMEELSMQYPGYGFEKHKGYGSAAHYESLDLLGPSAVHRMSFLKKYLAQKTEESQAASENGRRGEAVASQALAQKGYRIIASNWHCLYGELDLIAEDGRILSFCEVKTRSEDGLTKPKEAVTKSKQKKLMQAALCYLSEHPSGLQPRFDVIEVTLSHSGGAVMKVEHLENAFIPEQRNGGSEYASF